MPWGLRRSIPSTPPPSWLECCCFRALATDLDRGCCSHSVVDGLLGFSCSCLLSCTGEDVAPCPVPILTSDLLLPALVVCFARDASGFIFSLMPSLRSAQPIFIPFACAGLAVVACGAPSFACSLPPGLHFFIYVPWTLGCCCSPLFPPSWSSSGWRVVFSILVLSFSDFLYFLLICAVARSPHGAG